MHAQAIPTASRGLTAQLGGGFSFAGTDAVKDKVKGLSLFGSADLGSGIGIAVEFNDDNVVTPQDFGESSFLAGVRYGVRKGHFYPYAKVMAGVGVASYARGDYPASSSQSYFALGLGGGLDYRFQRHIFLRPIDFEYQDWRNFPPNGLTPYVVTFGAGYIWH